MSKEIYNYFDTIFWTSIKWMDLVLYTDRLISRIYKAINNKSYSKVFFLQEKLISSISVQYVASKEIFDNSNREPKLAQLQHLYYVERCYLNDRHNRDVEIHSIERNKFKESITNVLLSFVIKTQLDICIANNHVFLSLLKITNSTSSVHRTLQTHVNEYNYSRPIDLADFIYSLKSDYLISRILISKRIKCLLQNSLKKDSFLSYFQKLSKCNMALIKFNERDKLAVILFELIKYHLFIEVNYLHDILSSGRTISCSTQGNLKIISYGTEMLLLCNFEESLNTFHKLFIYIVYGGFAKDNNVQNMFSLTISRKLDFLGYLVIKTSSGKVIATPSKAARLKLLYSLSSVFNRAQSTSVQDLVMNLNIILLRWIRYFQDVRDYKMYALVDYLVYLKLRSWVRRKYKNLSSEKIKKNTSLIY